MAPSAGVGGRAGIDTGRPRQLDSRLNESLSITGQIKHWRRGDLWSDLFPVPLSRASGGSHLVPS